MSSVPREILRDVLLPLDRSTLDDVQFTDARFLRLITERMSVVCLRQVDFADFVAPNEEKNTDGTSFILIDGRPAQKTAHANTARLFSEFMQSLQSARVKILTLTGLVFTPELAEIVLQTSIFTDALILSVGSCAELTPFQFREVLMRFSPTALDIKSYQLRACQVTDELLRAVSKNHVRQTRFCDLVPVDGGSFCVTDDAIVDFCVQEDVQTGLKGAPPAVQLEVCNGSFTKQLFKRLVEASFVSKHTLPLRIVVHPLRFEDEDLSDFAQHLFQYPFGQRGQWRKYEFPGEQHGAAAAMHLQIVLRRGSRLELIRAPRPHPFFHK